MTVNIDIKGNLARLLATENLIVEHRKVDTASFDVERRVLTLPQWKMDSNVVYDMLVAHEVGHALHTPNRDYREDEKYKNLPHDYVNVVEDARIEKLMKKRFAGLNKDFYKGYEELHSINFFEVDEDEINDMKLIDRVNLYFKIGAYLCIDFTDEENQLITEISQADTFDEVLDLSLKMYEMGKEDQQQAMEKLADLVAKKKEDQSGQGISIQMNESENDSITDGNDQNQQVESPSDESENGQKSPVANDSQDETSDIDDLSEDEETQRARNVAGNHSEIDSSDTQRSFDSNVENLNDQEAREISYLTLPTKINLDSVVISHSEIRDHLKRHFIHEHVCSIDHDMKMFDDEVKKVFEEYNLLKRKARKDVNNMVKEFEMKKSADSYSRSLTSRTGMLDMNKLHTYKFNEDIFRKITTIPEGKNHGLVFLLDWSGSMNNQLADTIKQLFNLVWFCKKVGVAFEVYAFTGDAYSLKPHYENGEFPNTQRRIHHVNAKVGDFYIEDTFRMVNVLSSQDRARDLDESMKLLWTQTTAISWHSYLSPLSGFRLSGTPLNEAIVVSKDLIKNLIERENLQKCHCIVLTDGEGFHSSRLDYGHRWDDKMCRPEIDRDSMRASNIYPNSTVIRVGSKTVSGGLSDSEFTCNLVKAIKHDLPNTSFIGIRILERDYHSFYMRYGRKSFETFEDMKSLNKKSGMIHFESDSFDKWLAISTTKLNVCDELEVKEGAVKRDISTAFKKMNRGKKTNRVMVKEFVDQIA